MKKKDYKKIAKNVIDLEIKALRKLKKLHHIQFYYKFPTFFNDFMLAQCGVTSTKLQTIQQTCPNMLRFRALMSTKLHCA